jgi:uncharacterized protein YqgC (DUF456 family)
MFDISLIILSGLLITAGTIGCMLPVLPGPPLAYAGLLVLQVTSGHPFSTTFLVVYALLTAGVAVLDYIIPLVVYALLTAGVAVLDYIIPIYGTKKLEGSKYGIWGSTIGLVLGILFLFPAGIVIGPMGGAFAGELLNGKKVKKALKSAVGSFLGFLAGGIIKLILCLSMAYYFIVNIM